MSYRGTYHRLGLPITATDREIIRELEQRLRPAVRRTRAARHDRHAIFRAVLAIHRDARELAREYRL